MWISLAYGAGPDAGRLGEDVVPTAEHLWLQLDPAREDYEGTAEIALSVVRPVASFALHAEGLAVDSVSLRCGRRDAKAAATGEGTRLVVTTPRSLPPGPCALRVEFHARFGTDLGLYRHVSADGHAYLVTQLEPDEARTAWPCFDEPRFKIPWRLQIEAPADLAVLTGGTATRVVEGDRQRVTSELPALSSYLVALAVGPFVGTPFAEGAPGTVWTLPGREAGATHLAEVAPRHLRYLERWFGMPSPYARADFLAVPRFTYGAMENPGLVVGIEDELLDGPEATAAERRNTSYIAAHELAHFWFGDLVTLAWWDELWLNEAVADWMSARVMAEVEPGEGMAEEEVLELTGSIAADVGPSARPLTGPVDPDHVFETANLFQAYTKGGAVFDALEAWLGRDAFRDGVRRFVAAHAGGTATGRDLAAALSEASGRDVAPVFLPWVESPGAPRLDFTRGPDGAWSVAVSRLGGGDAPWSVPLAVRGQGGGAEVLARGPATPLPGLTGDWILPTPDGLGYFAWTAPPEAVAALLAAPERSSPIEQLAVLANLERVREVGALGLDDELAATAAVAPRTAAAGRLLLGPWREALAVADDAQRPAVRARLREHLRPVLLALGDAPRAGEATGTDAWRAELIELLGDGAQDEELRRRASDRVRRWLAGDELDPGTLGAWLWVAARVGDRALQDELLGRWRRTTAPEVRGALARAIGGVPGDEAHAVALGLSLEGDLPFALRMAFVDGVFADEASHGARLAWAMAHHEELVAQIPPPWRPVALPRFLGGCDPELFERGRAFYAASGLPGMEAALVRAGDGVTSCVARRSREGPELSDWLRAG